MPHFIKHKDDAGTSIVTKENDAQDRTRGAHEKQASKTIHTTMPNKKTSPCTSPSQEQGVRTPLRTRFLDRTGASGTYTNTGPERGGDWTKTESDKDGTMKYK